MKFQDIKIDDKVLKESFVSTGYSTGKYFFSTFVVIKVTKTQFVLSDGTRVRKSDGKIIGERYPEFVYNEGDTYYAPFHGHKVVKCQAKEHIAFLKKIHKVKKLRGKIADIYDKGQRIYDNMGISKIDEISKHIESIINIIN